MDWQHYIAAESRPDLTNPVNKFAYIYVIYVIVKKK